MQLTRGLWRNLNIPDWNRRVWEIGYRGPPLAKLKATGRPQFPISKYKTLLLRERFQREYEVMKLLARPYATSQMEKDYLAAQGAQTWDELRAAEKAEFDAQRMPGKPKKLFGSKNAIERVANYGNSLHSHATVEESLKDIIGLHKWD